MDFQLTQDQLQLQDAARKFARAELPALAQALEASNHAVPDDMLKRYGEMGFLGINIDEQYGGMGLGNLEALLVVEEFARISAPLPSRSLSPAPARSAPSNASARRP